MDERNLTPEERQALLGLARRAIARKLKKGPLAPEPSLSSELEDRQGGAFVSLHKSGRLRGCIGRFTADDSLPRTIEEMAQAAAFEDPRFPPLALKELDQIDVEISILTPMCRAKAEEVEVGRHGIYIVKGYCRGVLLPQVATDNRWDRIEFLKHTCLKAGLDADCWQDSQTEIYLFTAEVFGEKDRPACG